MERATKYELLLVKHCKWPKKELCLLRQCRVTAVGVLLYDSAKGLGSKLPQCKLEWHLPGMDHNDFQGTACVMAYKVLQFHLAVCGMIPMFFKPSLVLHNSVVLLWQVGWWSMSLYRRQFNDQQNFNEAWWWGTLQLSYVIPLQNIFRCYWRYSMFCFAISTRTVSDHVQKYAGHIFTWFRKDGTDGRKMNCMDAMAIENLW